MWIDICCTFTSAEGALNTKTDSIIRAYIYFNYMFRLGRLGKHKYCLYIYGLKWKFSGNIVALWRKHSVRARFVLSYCKRDGKEEINAAEGRTSRSVWSRKCVFIVAAWVAACLCRRGAEIVVTLGGSRHTKLYGQRTSLARCSVERGRILPHTHRRTWVGIKGECGWKIYKYIKKNHILVKEWQEYRRGTTCLRGADVAAFSFVVISLCFSFTWWYYVNFDS